MIPDGLPIWTSDAIPSHLHAELRPDPGVTVALNWSVAHLNVPALADAGYDGARPE
ncbi:hypothetical protein [Micromonospora sp. NPDC000018]|uniref:hypothetical protein n=1 Tax=unclassified Micromonospora TaxID=2617518 RepID=UPI003326BCCB